MYSLLASNSSRSYHSILDDLNPSEAHRLIEVADLVLYNEGDSIIEQGADAHHFYLIHQGKVSVKRDGFLISEIHPGGYFGLMSLFDHAPRSADVLAEESTVLYRLRYDVLRKPEFHQTFKLLTQLHIKNQQGYLRQMNDKVLDGYRDQLKLSESAKFKSDFLVRLICALIIFQFILGVFLDFEEYINGMMGWIFTPLCIFSLGLLSWLYIKNKNLDVRDYGWNFSGWKDQIPETLLATALICGGAILFKYILLLISPQSFDHTLFELDPIFSSNWALGLLIYSMYVLLVPIQEFVIRGVFQTGLYDIFDKPGKVWKAILMSNLMFSAFHLHQGFIFALVAFLPGFAWGYLYYRQKNLVGVIISHIILGIFALSLLGIV